MPMQLLEDAGGDPNNAQAMVLACELAYLAEHLGKPAFRDQLAMDAVLHSVGNTQAYVATNDEHIVVAFRGTEAPTSIEGLKDWLLTDAMNLLIVPEGRLGTDLAAAGVGARFHQGFVNAIADIWDPVFQNVDIEMRKSERPLWITGHSLGGALAMIAAWLFQRRMINVHQVYTFGAPMVGNDLAAKAYDRELRGKVFRYVNGPDPVPLLPTMSMLSNEYRHCEREMGLGLAEAAASAQSFFQTFAAQAVSGILNATLIDEFWTSLKARVDAHALTNYRGLILKMLGG